MSLKPYFIILLLSTILCWVMWGVVIFTINPEEASTTGILFFYSAIGLASMGTYVTAGFLLNMWLYRKKQPTGGDLLVLKPILKQGTGVGLGVIIFLLLLKVHLLKWWNSIILLILLACLIKTMQKVKTAK